jgi:2-C-methyl-D-erythritol 4-phosphate cytidylyltransferase / 2-C-methyl-D-erythritol 2,4-cyclodiphosphate synthase
MKPTVNLLIVAAGSGQRAQAGMPKQFAVINGVSVLDRSLRVALELSVFEHIFIALPKTEIDLYRNHYAQPGVAIIAGGETRQASVLAGLEAMAARAPTRVLIHDAARCLVSPQIFHGVLAALDTADAAAPALPVTDSLRRQSPDGLETIDREALFTVQTPQGFRYAPLLAAHREAAGLGLSDDLAVAARAGLRTSLVTGDPDNLKITHPEDFRRAERLLAGRMNDIRTGAGFDVHAFEPGDHVWLCGVRVPHTHALAGHSDADVGLHALTDAILGAIAEGDIGKHFPPSDPQWRGAASDRFLAHAVKLVTDRGGMIGHLDITLVCERPKIAPHVPAMRARIADIARIDPSRVSVKATTTERLGFTGREEGIAAQAVATVRLPQ